VDVVRCLPLAVSTSPPCSVTSRRCSSSVATASDCVCCLLSPIGTIPITETGINPVRSLGAAIIFNRDHAWNDQHISPWFPIKTLMFPILYIDLAKALQKSSNPAANSSVICSVSLPYSNC
ncbi:hypothetical protein HN873_043684, partial [Arachis hypogaea]